MRRRQSKEKTSRVTAGEVLDYATRQGNEKSHLRNQKTKPTLVVGFIFCSRDGSVLHDLRVMRTTSGARWVARQKTSKRRFLL